MYKSLIEVMNSFEQIKADTDIFWCREPINIDPNNLPLPVQHEQLESVM